MNRVKVVVLALSAVLLFVWGAERQATRVNTDVRATDQNAYLNYSRNLAETDFGYVGRRNRMPAYPALMSLFYRDDMTRDEFFGVGKQVGIVLGLIVLAGTFLLFRSSGHPRDAVTGTLVAGYTVFAFRSPYFQAEVLYYGISLVLFWLLLSLIQRPRATTAVLAGCAGGLAFLTKASVLPVMLLAVACLSWRMIAGLKNRKHEITPSFVHSALSAGVLAATFFLVVSPYILTSKERFGSYFYNVNSTFYMWYDSWEEVEAGTRAHGDRVGWPDMPEEDIPSLRHYIRDHSPLEIGWRLVSGLAIVAGVSLFEGYGYGLFMLLYAAVVATFFVQNKGSPHVKRLRDTNRLRLFFIVAYFCGYWALYAWYVPIAYGNRFNLALFLPAMLLFVGSFSFFRAHGLSISALGRRAGVSEINRAILLMLGLYLLTIYPWLISTMYAGR
jgi:hypothetical protein